MFKRSPEEIQEYKEMNRLEPRFLAYPPLAIEQSRLAINNMAAITKKSVYLAKNLLDEYSEKGVAEIEHMELLVDKYEDKSGNVLQSELYYSREVHHRCDITIYGLFEAGNGKQQYRKR